MTSVIHHTLRLFTLTLLTLLPASAWSQSPTATQPQPEATRPEGVVQPFLWRIEGPTTHYILGTIHVPDQRVLDMHPAIKKAIANSKQLYVEIAPQDITAQSRVLLGLDQNTKQPRIDDQRKERIDQQLGEIQQGLSFNNFSSAPIWAWAILLPSLKAQFSHPDQPVLDMKLIQLAQQRKLPIHSLEDPTTQLSGFKALTHDEQLQFLDSTLDSMTDDADAEEDSLEALIDIYLKGDADALAKFFEDEFSEDSFSEELRDKLLNALMVQRNRKIADRMIKVIKDTESPSCLFAAGTAHFVVEPSVITYLQNAGIKVSRITDADALKDADSDR